MDKRRIFVIGDIHGAYRALVQCLERSGFDRGQDRLIVLGDVCDGYPDVRQCIDELLKVRHCDLIMGNHDQWALDWASRGLKPNIWTSQGGDSTIASYGGGPMPPEHIEFLKSAKPWLELEGRVFVHGGFNPLLPLDRQPVRDMMWDRGLLEEAWRRSKAGTAAAFGGYEDIFIGHTTTLMYQSLEPIHACNIWDIDTGAGWSGKLTIMEVSTKTFWQSDLSPELYAGIKGRGGFVLAT